MSRENVELIKKLYADFANGNISAVLAEFSDDSEWHVPPGHKLGKVYRGPQAIGEFST